MLGIPCIRCGKPAEPLLTVQRSRLPAGWPASSKGPGRDDSASYTFCLECLQALRQHEPCSAGVERQVLSGSICALCHTGLDDTPGGYAVPSRECSHLFRLCARCRDAVESRRSSP
jgi:hypothetical protein